MRLASITALAGISCIPAVSATVEARLVYQFPNSTFIENVAIRPNGQLVLNTFDDARIYTIDPSAAEPEPKLVAKIPGVTGVTGIAQIAPDVFAVSGGINDIPNFTWEAGSAQIWTLDLSKPCDAAKPLLKNIAKLPQAEILNGMTSLPSSPHIILSVDSKTGILYRIDTQTELVDVAFQSDMLGLGSDPILPLGANGIHVYEEHLWFTNSAQGFFGRVKIESTGESAGEPEVISRLMNNSTVPMAYDDFTQAANGDFYVTQHPQYLFKISSEGEQTIILDGSTSIVPIAPTAAAASSDLSKVYVVTGGSQTEGNLAGGQVIELSFDSDVGVTVLPFM
jgi:hypothetical protein